MTRAEATRLPSVHRYAMGPLAPLLVFNFPRVDLISPLLRFPTGHDNGEDLFEIWDLTDRGAVDRW